MVFINAYEYTVFAAGLGVNCLLNSFQDLGDSERFTVDLLNNLLMVDHRL